MKKVQTISLFLGLIITLWYACKRVDDEPIYPASPISRLYISYSDVESQDTDPYNNIAIIDPADSAGYFPQTIYTYNSDPNQGMGIVFDPYLGKVFQVSRRDSSVRSFTVAENGTLTSSTNFRDTVSLPSARAIRYNRVSDHLIVSDNSPDTPAIHLFYAPTRLAQQQKAQYKAILQTPPWGITLSNDDDSTLMVSTDTAHQILEFPIRSLKVNDTVTAQHTITINGATSTRGLTYSPILNILIVADPGVIGTTDGKVYIIEDAKNVLSQGGTITPTRVISGTTATLIDPVDVAVDDRRGRTNYIYVADRGGSTKRILRFTIEASGNVAPEAVKNLGTLSPEFIYLDARGGESTEDGQ